ncbi:MAG: 30S ribosomal protein S14 [Gammaproteobacteria bacterium RIFCSPHIGHO2_12_FULL_38_11]|nr:MAG: 30S ribosomal protein S14 [Gammaproteobacteria bacterium RIFCSPHIGHO2_12_FULL_38_11]
MAKTSIMIRNKRRKELSQRMKSAREALKETIRTDEENRDDAIDKLQKRRRNECSIRVRNRCRQCGRSRGTLKRFGLCRIHLREAAMRGDVPGLRKASW